MNEVQHFLRPTGLRDPIACESMKTIPVSWLMNAVRGAWLAAVVTLGACGGGGDAATPAAPETPIDVPTSTGSTCGIANFSAAALARINQLRAAGADCRTAGKFPAAAALTWNALLTQAAEAHTQDMVAKSFFGHTGSNNSTLQTRVDLTGYKWSALGENIAAGYDSIDSMLAGLMASDGHCANIMNASFSEVGMVCVAGTASSTYNSYWTMDFGRPR